VKNAWVMMPNQDDQEEEEGKECCADVLDSVYVFCVLLLQTATLIVLLQTAQFQHLQSPKTEHPKQRFFFQFAQVKYLLTYFCIFCGFCNLLTGFSSHSLSTNFTSHLPMHTPTYPPICLTTHEPTYLPTHPFAFLPMNLPTYLPTHLPSYP
jgi:hypothetical protein